MKINIINSGLISYGDALDIQYKLVEKRKNNEIEDTLLLMEHNPVITLGTRGDYDNIYLPKDEMKKQGVETFEVNRGGDVTYHGPGQIVGYPIFDMRNMEEGIRVFIDNIEQSIIKLLKHEYNIDAYGEKDKYTGVWVGDTKIAALGIAVRRSITMHGFAFNVNTNLEHFKWINPCGLSKGVTSVEKIMGEKQDIAKIFTLVEEYFTKQFNRTKNNIDIEDILPTVGERCQNGF